MRIVSDKWSPDTTSNVAAGIFLWGPHVLDPDTGDRTLTAETDLYAASYCFLTSDLFYLQL